jgi:hypothetical protein
MATTLSPTRQARFRRLATDLRRVFGDRFVALVAYGGHTAAAFATRIDPADLDAMATLTGAWHHDGLATPLVMTPDEFRRSLDAFPLEYQAILDHHILIDGENPFDGAAVAPADLRRACEVQAKSHLVHLRQGWLEAHGHAEELTHLAGHSAMPFRTLLSHVARLSGEPHQTADDLVVFAGRVTGMPADLARDLFTVDEHPEAAHRVSHRMADYLAAAERLWAFVDAWGAR